MPRKPHVWEHKEKGSGNCGLCGKPCSKPVAGAVVFHGACAFPKPVPPYKGLYENFLNKPEK